MYTSIVLVALAGSVAGPAAVTNSPSWHRDYDAAYQLGRREHKPLAVFVNHGSMGWQNVIKEGKLNPESEKLLHEHYICVYVDTNSSADEELAGSFEMPDGVGLVLSDHTGQAQAFRHEGTLSASDLERNLRTYADPERIVQRTETQVDEQVRNYYSPAQPIAPPVYPFGSFGGFPAGRGGC